MVSNVIGQGLQEKVMEVVNRITWLSLGFAVVFVGIINLFPESILLFYGQNQAFVALAIPVVRVVSWAILFMSMGAIAINGINGTGNTRVTLYLEIIAIIFYCGYTYIIF